MNGMARTPAYTMKMERSLGPIAGTGSAQNGVSVDRLGYYSALLTLLWSTSGGVTGGTITVRLEDSDTGSGNWVAFGPLETVTIPAGPNASGSIGVSRNLDGARRYIRAVVDSDPTGGSPASLVAAAVGLTSADAVPVA